MTVATALMVYAIIWWLVFFMTLPFGVRTAEEAGEKLEPGAAESAPVKPRLFTKAMITTLIASFLWMLYYLVATYDLLGLEDYLRN